MYEQMANSVLLRESDVERSSNVFEMYAQLTGVWWVDEASVWHCGLCTESQTGRHFQGDVSIDDDDRPACRWAVAAVIIDRRSWEEREQRQVDSLTCSTPRMVR